MSSDSSVAIRKHVQPGPLLTRDFLSQRMIRRHDDGTYSTYHRHPNGGGWVADDSYVPIWLRVPVDVTVGPGTRLLEDQNIFGLAWIQGSTRNRVAISRPMANRDKADIALQNGLILLWLTSEGSPVAREMQLA
ncbi:MAG: hypothetical protein EON54_18810 [Alcaligenaceae bacterium]|nr:MAG: hypothetical protein EON54_18810 [Alcaligenaceae bacterium]